MSSGRREMQLNTQERALSTDVNRLQKFVAFDQGEFFRYLLSTQVNDDLDAAAVVTESAGLEAPMRAEVINGLTVRPQSGSRDLLIDPGVLYALSPDGDPDASNYKFVRDPGVPLLGALTMTANASGSIRIDIIECQVTNLVIEEDNRDFFDSVTGLFTASTVTKATEGRLVYRVRMGTPGGGFPGAVAGWLPLAVALVADTSTTNDNIVFWDVRPTLNDRIYGSAPVTLARPRPWVNDQALNFATLTTGRGIVEAHLNGRRVGGRIRSGNDLGPTLTADSDLIDLTNAINLEAGFTQLTLTDSYVYLCTPFGLPRWARYTTGPANRKPRSPRGIPIRSMVPPDLNGRPSSPIPMPASWGSGVVAVTDAVCIVGGITKIVATTYGVIANAGDVRRIQGFKVLPVLAGPLATWTLTPGVHYPAHAKSIRFTARMAATGVYPNDTMQVFFRVLVYDELGVNVIHTIDLQTVEVSLGTVPTSFATQITNTFDVPIPTSYPTAPTQLKFAITAVTPTGGASITNVVYAVTTAQEPAVIGYTT